jgi:hypothetical protein
MFSSGNPKEGHPGVKGVLHWVNSTSCFSHNNSPRPISLDNPSISMV